MSRLIPLVMLSRLLSLILLVPLMMRGLLSLAPRLILMLLRLMRGVLSPVPRLILLLLLMWRLPLLLIRRVTFTVALAASAAIAAFTSLAPPALAASSGVKASSQGMAAVSPVQVFIELFHTDEATLQVT